MDHKDYFNMGDHPIADNVFEATWNSHEAAAKLVALNREKAKTEIKAYKDLKDVARIVRCFDDLKDKDYHYIVLQRAECNLLELINACKDGVLEPHRNINCRDFLKRASKDYVLWETDDQIEVAGVPTRKPSASPDLVQLIKDIIDGVTDLQNKRVRHGNLTPENILIFEEINEAPCKNRLRAKLSNLGSCSSFSSSSSKPRKLDTSTKGWKTPEEIKKHLTDEKSDLFGLGLIIGFCLTGRHPFGNDANVNGNSMDIPRDYLTPEVKRFITDLLKQLPHERLAASSLLLHPMFWDDTTNAWFICEIHDLLPDLNLNSAASAHLHRKSSLIMNGGRHWDVYMDDGVLTLYRDNGNTINPYSVQSLVTMFRNICQHLSEYKGLVGNSKASAYRFLVKDRFPHLLIEVYTLVKIYYPTDERFERLF